MLNLILMLLLGYLIGSFPTSIIAGRLLRGIDIRSEGSGNAGATNVFRVLGWQAGVLVLLIDIFKGWISTVWVSQWGIAGGTGLAPVDYQILAGLAAVFGHIWTVFAGFKGGKGVAAGAGMLIGLAPEAVVVCIVAFVAVVAITRYVSLGSMLGALAFPAVIFFQRFKLGIPVASEMLIFSSFIPVLIIYTHRSNITRLLRGAESKISIGKKPGNPN